MYTIRPSSLEYCWSINNKVQNDQLPFRKMKQFGIYRVKVGNGNNRAIWKIYSKLRIKTKTTPIVLVHFIINFEQILHIVLSEIDNTTTYLNFNSKIFSQYLFLIVAKKTRTKQVRSFTMENTFLSSRSL